MLNRLPATTVYSLTLALPFPFILIWFTIASLKKILQHCELALVFPLSFSFSPLSASLRLAFAR